MAKQVRQITNSGLTFAGRAPRPGDLKFKDLNNDKIIDTRDFAPIGYSNVPQYTFGATVGINYKDFDLSILFQGVSNVSQDYRGWEFGKIMEMDFLQKDI